MRTADFFEKPTCFNGLNLRVDQARLPGRRKLLYSDLEIGLASLSGENDHPNLPTASVEYARQFANFSAYPPLSCIHGGVRRVFTVTE
ncbi:hypothetical protein AYM39_07505 [Methylomonas sp. DH-1]|nr:hypothetical protein AYM39_07505 [Methylomonas sp. DH-1]